MAKTFNDALLVEEYRKCRRCRIVAEKYGCSGETVRRALIKFNEPRIIRHPREKTKAKASEEELKSIVEEYYATDADINTLAKKYHRAKTTISKAIKELGHGLKGNAINDLKITDGQLIEACKTMTRQEIADVYGMHVATIDRRMNRLGIHAVRVVRKSSNRSRYQHTWEEYVAEAKAKAEARRAEKEKEKATANAIRIIWAIAEKRKDKYCAECGGVFHSEYPNKIYCSDRCQRKHRDRSRPKRRNNGSIRSRCRKYGVYFDPSVKPELVFKRDHMICQICGEKCNSEDHTWGDKGPLYPSVDHIIPLAKGGAHIWDNVQTAHIICNSFKRDLLTEEANCG